MKPPFVDPWLNHENLADYLQRRGVSRRQFLAHCGKVALLFGAGLAVPGLPVKVSARDLASRLGQARRPRVIWLQLQECTGCLESALRSGSTPVDQLLLELISLDYNELLMAPAGEGANAQLAAAAAEPHLLVVNGSVPLKEGGAYCTIGGEAAGDLLKRTARVATAVLAVGACAVDGSVQGSGPNPTGAVGVSAVLRDRPVVNLSGCPPIGEVITATLSYYLAYGRTPPVDPQGRPLFAYGQRIHDKCPRRAHFDAGQFAERFDDENARRGYCLYHLGCKGPVTSAPCPILEWNLGQSFPIKAGHPCLGCTEAHFFDRMSPFYRRLPDIGVPELGVEASANLLGLGMTAAAVAGVAVHAGATVVAKQRRNRREPKSVPLPILGDTEAENEDKPPPVEKT